MSEVRREADLGSGRRIDVRTMHRDDLEAVVGLYGRLGASDLRRRFFTGGPPPVETVERWVGVGDSGRGVSLLAELLEPGLAPVVIAEAGCAPLESGDAELGITVDPAHRGWLGPWLLDAVLEAAADAGFANVQALVAADNTPMRALLVHRGAAAMPTDDWSTARFTIGARDRIPHWPDQGRRRLLVESPRTRWPGHRRASSAGFDVIVCSGPDSRRGRCPVLEGRRCPLVEGADGVIVALADEEQAERLAQAHAAGGADVVVRQWCSTADAASEALADVVAQAGPPPDSA